MRVHYNTVRGPDENFGKEKRKGKILSLSFVFVFVLCLKLAGFCAGARLVQVMAGSKAKKEK
jgi:hypothetical protein